MALSMTNVRGIGDIAPIYKWDLKINQLPALPVGHNTTAKDLNARCESAEMPKASNSAIIVQIRGHRTKYAGIQEYGGTITLTFIETADSPICKFFRAWREASWESITGVQQVQKNEGMEAKIELARQNRQHDEIFKYLLIGCWLEDYDPGGTLDGASSEAVKPSATISYDYFVDGEQVSQNSGPNTNQTNG